MFLVEEKSEKIASGKKGKEIWGYESGAQAPGGKLTWCRTRRRENPLTHPASAVSLDP